MSVFNYETGIKKTRLTVLASLGIVHVDFISTLVRRIISLPSPDEVRMLRHCC